MNDWTIGSFLSALLLIILGGAGLGTLLQRSFFFKHEKPKSGTELFVEWNARKLRGSLATVAGLVVAMATYPLLASLGLSNYQWAIGTFFVVGVLVMLVLIN